MLRSNSKIILKIKNNVNKILSQADTKRSERTTSSKPKKGDYFYVDNLEAFTLNTYRTRHKIKYLEKDKFEWGVLDQTISGWSEIKNLKPNSNKNSKVKWILVREGE